MKKFLMKILSDELRILWLSPNLWYWHCKDIKLSGTLQNEQLGVLITKLKCSTLRNHDLVTTPAQDSLN